MTSVEELLLQAQRIQDEIFSLNEQRRESDDWIYTASGMLINMATSRIAQYLQQVVESARQLGGNDQRQVLRWVLGIISSLQIISLKAAESWPADEAEKANLGGEGSL